MSVFRRLKKGGLSARFTKRMSGWGDFSANVCDHPAAASDDPLAKRAVGGSACIA